MVCGPAYVELAAHPKSTVGFLDEFMADTKIVVDFDFDEPLWRKASDGFASYATRRRSSGGEISKRLLADFVIAAHALLRADQFMTLDARRYAEDFPTLRMVSLSRLRNQ